MRQRLHASPTDVLSRSLGAAALLAVIGLWIRFEVVSHQTTREVGEIRAQTESTLESLQHSLARSEIAIDQQSIEDLRGSIVRIGIRWFEPEPFEQEPKYKWIGTGFIIDEPAVIVTAAHVCLLAMELTNANSNVDADIVVKMPSSIVLEVLEYNLHPDYDELDPVKDEPCIDVALLSVNADALSAELTVPLATEQPMVGEKCFVLAYPTEVPEWLESPNDAMVRIGRIERLSSLAGTISEAEGLMIQCDIPMVGGFSGAPLLNSDGRAIGVVTFVDQWTIPTGGIDLLTGEEAHRRIINPAHFSVAIGCDALSQCVDALQDNVE